MKARLGIKALFFASEALPTDDTRLIGRRKEGVVVFDLVVAFGTTGERFVEGLWIGILRHFA